MKKQLDNYAYLEVSFNRGQWVLFCNLVNMSTNLRQFWIKLMNVNFTLGPLGYRQENDKIRNSAGLTRTNLISTYYMCCFFKRSWLIILYSESFNKQNC